MRGQPARRVRRAGTGKPATETLHGAPSPTQQIQALDRTQPMLPVRPGLPASRTHDNVRHGTTTLYAALEVATGKITDACYDRHQEFLRFLRQVAKAYPRRKLHIVVDNYAAHKHEHARRWLAKHPRITLHFTPTSAGWCNLVEPFFAIITRQAIHRGSFASVDDLEAAIRTYILAAVRELFATNSPPATSTRCLATSSIGLTHVQGAKDILLGGYGMSARDTLHLAEMDDADITRVMSFDAGFDSYPGVERLD